MRIDNRLTRAYIESYPADAARTLEGLPAQIAAPLMAGLDTSLAAALLGCMMPAAAAACLAHCPPGRTAALLKAVPAAAAGRILAAPVPAGAAWPPRMEGLDIRPSYYSADTVGYHAQGAGLVLPDDLTVAEALRRARRRDADPGCEIYIVDRAYLLRGQVQVTDLLRAAPAASLRSLVRPAPAALPARTLLEAAHAHPAWDVQRRLPVVDERGALLGAIPYKAVRDGVGPAQSKQPGVHVIDTAMDVIGLYWAALAAATDALLPAAAGRRRDRGP